ncbi:MAG: NAD(P)H-dependent oxidoreductase [Actinobacteria bacterium]|nr:NAD(P)H-dependent oxidoreductase [Actinomycetota bacterium]
MAEPRHHPRPRLLLVSGSLRTGSTNEATLRTVQDLAAPIADADLYDGVGRLPHFNPDDDHEPLPDTVVELRAAIAASDALLICTPEYAGALPGALKNLLDWTVGGIETEGKPAAWINVSTGGTAAAGTHASLRTVLTYTGCEVADDACAHVPIPRAAIVDGAVADVASLAAISRAVGALVAHVERARTAQ